MALYFEGNLAPSKEVNQSIIFNFFIMHLNLFHLLLALLFKDRNPLIRCMYVVASSFWYVCFRSILRFRVSNKRFLWLERKIF